LKQPGGKIFGIRMHFPKSIYFVGHCTWKDPNRGKPDENRVSWPFPLRSLPKKPGINPTYFLGVSLL
jgi:hypothetical protein